MRIIDADSHFMEPFNWFEENFPEIFAKCPPVPLVEVVLEALMGDLVTSLPAGLDIRARDLLPKTLVDTLDRFVALEAKSKAGSQEASEELAALQEARSISPAQYEGKARLAWADEQGIDVQVMLPTLGVFPFRTAMKLGLRDVAFETLGAYNSWAAAQLAGYTERLVPVTLVDLGDLDWSLAELQRMRALGSRMVQIKAEPVAGKSLAHPDFEPLWSLLEDLGMWVMLHVGGGRAPVDTGWVNNDGHPLDLSLMYNAYVRRLVPELALSALILRGVFERHPKLRFIVAELGVQWVPGFGERLDAGVDRTNSMSAMTGRSYDNLKLKPSAYFERQVRVAALASEPGLDDAIRRSPEGMLVFSSDFPHPEGSPDPGAVFDGLLGERSEAREQFYGGSAGDFLGL